MNALEGWHHVVRTRDPKALAALLADEVTFWSPVVHSPQRGRQLATMYLGGAMLVIGNEHFRYVREIAGERDACLEFESQVDGLTVNGVDLIRWNDDGRIVDFKVMLRPMKAIEAVKARMAAMLPGKAPSP